MAAWGTALGMNQLDTKFGSKERDEDIQHRLEKQKYDNFEKYYNTDKELQNMDKISSIQKDIPLVKEKMRDTLDRCNVLLTLLMSMSEKVKINNLAHEKFIKIYTNERSRVAKQIENRDKSYYPIKQIMNYVAPIDKQLRIYETESWWSKFLGKNVSKDVRESAQSVTNKINEYTTAINKISNDYITQISLE